MIVHSFEAHIFRTLSPTQTKVVVMFGTTEAAVEVSTFSIRTQTEAGNCESKLVHIYSLLYNKNIQLVCSPLLFTSHTVLKSFRYVNQNQHSISMDAYFLSLLHNFTICDQRNPAQSTAKN